MPDGTFNLCVLTQLFFFFFLASCSLRLPILEWLVVLVRLEMLSEEFWRLISISKHQEKESKFHLGWEAFEIF